MKDKKRFIPKGKKQIITIICLLVEIVVVMPFIIGKLAELINNRSASFAGVWSIIDLVIINIVWVVTWLLTYRFANQYITEVLKPRNVKMGLLIVGTIYTLETVVNNNYALVAVFSIIAYLSLWAWFDYVFSHPLESSQLINRTDNFIKEHKHLNRSEVQKLINENNNEVIDWLENHIPDKKKPDEKKHE
ncbi:hypothetical protein MOO44_01650 (plasmid) [Nicoliella spurrieriana]|uniref:Uncharacterized protein n=1 Tax=Nicoliella spurrieriana TaxID=2925830 RepID=A0A976RQI3_9LACO|nr:hypothetical protein [Nicoliella spurrieriana]UQS86052.1 hypothetical protein MOO44_01650 [Nicoliella spurrieriana]